MSCSTNASRSAGDRRLQDDEQRHTDRVGQYGLLFRVDRLGRCDALGDNVIERLLGLGAAGPQHVQADAGDDRRQPAAQVARRR